MNTVYNSTYSVQLSSNKIISQIVLDVLTITNLLILGEIVAMFGVVTNVINIIIFRRHGYQDGVNITLTALAISDIGALVVQQAYGIIITPLVKEYDLVLKKTDLLILMSYVHVYFIRVSGLITSFAAFERCLCVVIPMKVKDVITQKVSLLVNITLFTVGSLYLFPFNYIMTIDWVLLPSSSMKVLQMVYKSNREEALTVSFIVTDLCVPCITVVCLIFFPLVIILQLRSKTKWRQTVTVTGEQDTLSSKERKLVVMLTTVSIIFVICLLPQSVFFTVIGFIRELKSGGTYFEITILCYKFTSLLETVHCSLNIFVYYSMSGKYRRDMHLILASLKRNLKFCLGR